MTFVDFQFFYNNWLSLKDSKDPGDPSKRPFHKNQLLFLLLAAQYNVSKANSQRQAQRDKFGNTRGGSGTPVVSHYPVRRVRQFSMRDKKKLKEKYLRNSKFSYHTIMILLSCCAMLKSCK